MSDKLYYPSEGARKILYCDFCGITEITAEYLIQAPFSNICICDKCVPICVKELKKYQAKKRAKEKSAKTGK